MRSGAIRALLLLAALAGAATQNGTAQVPASRDSFSFAVIGHVRGGEQGGYNYLVNELIQQLKQQRPDLIFLTGDMIWGDYTSAQVRRSVVEADWVRLDSAFATVGVPVYRVPGNHDINDPITRDIYFQRYGKPPQVVTHGNSRFLLLNSSYVPTGDSLPRRRRPFIGGVPLDSAQIGFVRRALADTARSQHNFVLLHHVLWWDDDAEWWRTVHPALVGKVRAVFAGDYGPMKFSHEARDGIDYIQSAIEDFPALRILQRREDSRLLYQQFDNYVLVTVSGPRVRLEVKTLGPISGKKFTPQQWHAIKDYSPSLSERARELFGSRKRAALIVGALGAAFLLGVAVALAGRRLALTRKPSSP
jgi:hypothetical protein